MIYYPLFIPPLSLFYSLSLTHVRSLQYGQSAQRNVVALLTLLQDKGNGNNIDIDKVDKVRVIDSCENKCKNNYEY